MFFDFVEDRSVEKLVLIGTREAECFFPPDNVNRLFRNREFLTSRSSKNRDDTLSYRGIRVYKE